MDLPDCISKSFNKLLEASQQTSVKYINQYLHWMQNSEDKDSIGKITIIVQTCPEFLATKSKGLICY